MGVEGFQGEGERRLVSMGGDELGLGRVLEFDREARRIRLAKRSLLPEDDIAFRFARVLEESGVRYAVVAGYVAILLGRARRSDDVDFIIERIGEEEFVGVCRRALERGFTLMQGDISSEESVRMLYRSYLAEGYGVRFMYRDLIIPNVEVKMAKTSIDLYTLEHSLIVEVEAGDGFTVRVSPLELQIAYKLRLGSGKDVGDAVFLYELFREALNHSELDRWCRELGADCSIIGGVQV